jgi:opacity protein-like surface antigen
VRALPKSGVVLKRSLFAGALLGVALVSLPFTASAQVSTIKPFQIGIAAGAALPMSDLKDATDIGFNVTGTIGFHPQMIPLGIRVDVAYNSFSGKDGFFADADSHFTSVTGNLVWSIPSEAVSPYFIGGAGLYNVDTQNVFGESGNKFGFNIGGGIKMPLSGFDTFIEARYNQVSGSDGFPSLKFIPITFGLMF